MHLPDSRCCHRRALEVLAITEAVTPLVGEMELRLLLHAPWLVDFTMA